MHEKTASSVGVDYQLQLDILSDGYEGECCWFQPRLGVIPAPQPAQDSTLVLTMQKFWMPQSDAFFPIHSQQSSDLGKSWSPLVEQTATLGRETLPDGIIEGVCDFTPKWHRAGGKLIGTGHTVLYYPGNKLVRDRRRYPFWSVYEPGTQSWSHWKALALPDEPRFWMSGAGCTQRVDLENGDILLPIYSRSSPDVPYLTTIVRCRYEDNDLKVVETSTGIELPVERGLYEPSLARWNGKFYLTMRNDLAAYGAVSDDGMTFSTPRKWTFDDGEDLGSYNTQAHWVTHSGGLFLIYTRRGADNDHVMRHRAPLFMARVDPAAMVVIRDTERIVVPNKGAQLGNFGVRHVNERETWVTTSELMAPGEPQKYGANGRVYAARILWDKPNLAWDKD